MLEKSVTHPSVSQDPLNILFNLGSISKKDVWDIDLLQILSMMARVLEESNHKDLRMAGIAAMSSSLIYRMKVDSIFALHQEATKKQPVTKRNIDIDTIQMPYRHQTTYAVTLDELVATLKNLVITMANPRIRGTLRVEPTETPDMRSHLLSLESAIKQYQNYILDKLLPLGRAKFQDMVSGLGSLDSIRCFFAALFLARDGRITLEQDGEEVMMVLLEQRQVDNSL